MRILPGVLAAGLALLAAGCGGVTQPLEVSDVSVSQDGLRLQLTLGTCNEDVTPLAEESDEAVTISVDDNRPAFQGSRDECLEYFVVPLTAPLGDRTVIEERTGDVLAVAASAPDPSEWPYDADRVTQAEYEAALEAVVECVMAADPAVTAWVEQGLEWKYWTFTKAPDEDGTMSMEAIAPCEAEFLEPLR